MPTFMSPRIYHGAGSLDALDMIRGSKCFITTDKVLLKLGTVQILLDKLKSAGKEWVIFDEVEPDPKETTILRATKQCIAYGPDLVIGLGGGSSLDTAKTVWFLYEHAEDGLTIDDINPFGDLHMGIKAKCIAIPTTSGTGAEVTWAVVITRIEGEKNMKLEQPHPDIVPTYAIVDPIFTKSLPKSLTAATGFDALAHSCEGLLATWRNDLADANCIGALSLIKEFLPKAYHDGSDMIAREKMANAATLAGLGFGNSNVIIGHSLGHTLGAIFHLTHGLAVGLVLPYILEFIINDKTLVEAQKILGKASRQIGLCSWTETDQKAVQAFIRWIRNLQKEVNLPQTLAAAGITKEALNANMEKLVLLTNESPSITLSPRNASNEEIRKLYEYIYAGKPIDF